MNSRRRIGPPHKAGIKPLPCGRAQARTRVLPRQLAEGHARRYRASSSAKEAMAYLKTDRAKGKVVRDAESAREEIQFGSGRAADPINARLPTCSRATSAPAGYLWVALGRCLLPPATATAQLSKNSRWIEVRFHKRDIVTGQIDSVLRCSARV